MNKFFAIDPNKQYRVYPKEVMAAIDKGEVEKDDAPYFIIQPMKASVAAKVEDNLSETKLSSKGQDNTMLLKSGTSVLDTLKTGLKGWGNFYVSEGVEAVFRENAGYPKSECIDAIPSPWRREIADAIQEGKGLTEHEVKNSD